MTRIVEVVLTTTFSRTVKVEIENDVSDVEIYAIDKAMADQYDWAREDDISDVIINHTSVWVNSNEDVMGNINDHKE